MFKIKNFYDRMNFDAVQHLEITKAIIKLTDSSTASGLVQNKPYGGRRFETPY